MYIYIYIYIYNISVFSHIVLVPECHVYLSPLYVYIFLLSIRLGLATNKSVTKVNSPCFVDSL